MVLFAASLAVGASVPIVEHGLQVLSALSLSAPPSCPTLQSRQPGNNFTLREPDSVKASRLASSRPPVIH